MLDKIWVVIRRGGEQEKGVNKKTLPLNTIEGL
jgi:hypothetical protein